MSRKYLLITEVPVLGGCAVRPRNDHAPIASFYPRGEVFKRTPVAKFINTGHPEWTSSCLRELADAMDKQYPRTGKVNREKGRG